MRRPVTMRILGLFGLVSSIAAVSQSAQAASPTFTTKLTAPTATVAAGATTTVTVQVSCTGGTLSGGIIDVELYNSAGSRVKQNAWSSQSLSTGQSKSYSFSWSQGTAGAITTKVGVFAPNWSSLYHWNNTAGTINVGATATRPAAPTNLTAAAGDAQALLSWAGSSSATSYTVKRSTTSGGPYSTVASGRTTTTYTNTGLTNGTTYYYVVTAVNGTGESANSNQAVATPKASAPLPTPQPSGLPAHFSFGLSNNPTELSWMTGTNVPWGYRYQYLVGGVNTGNSWTTWNSPAGQFATYYMQDSRAHGYIPVFTYYQIVQSAPNSGNENVDTKLQNTSTMKAYFTEWKLLMQKAGQFGGTVIIHHEPDMWGFLQSSHGDDATKSPVAVASSGFPEVAGFPNNASGFARALIAIRNTYAPNALIAWHASNWATGVDLAINNADPSTAATRTTNFYKSLSANFDLIFFDPSDRDAGFYQYVNGDRGAHWWDDTEFTRFRQFIGAITQATGKRAMLWQVPIGNTLYRSCNNTWNHYQDNRAQYFLQDGNRAHIQEYANAGVIGVLFGRGADGPTHYGDANGDGVTNPPAINGNNLVATYPDDDGGFIRIQAGAYYRAGAVPLPN